MRLSKLFFQTLREVPADADVRSHQLMLRAGLVRQVAAGIFDFLPLGLRVKHKIEQILREEMDAIDGQEVSLPVVQPAELWQRTGRWQAIGDDLARLQDRNGRDLVLGMTHEEVITEMAAGVINSYRQLPQMLYQIQTKFRDEPRPRGGLIRVREFTMKDAYSFHSDFADLDAYYPDVYQAYFNIFRRAGLQVIAVESDTGMMGGTMAHEFMALTPIGEDTLLLCDACHYAANRQIATFVKEAAPAEEVLALEEVETPHVNTIAALADFLGVPESRTAKAIFLVAEVDGGAGKSREQFVFVVMRGDMELNETKLTNAIAARRVRPATIEEIKAIGAQAGYGSPVGIDRGQVLLVVDDLIPRSSNLVAGANREGWHYKNVNYGRDYAADRVLDIAAAAEGHGCPVCGEPLRSVRGVEVGNIFKLGTKYSAAMDALYLDEKGESHPLVMGCYGIGSGRLIASVIENSNDENGIIWPVTIAPYHVHLVSLATPKQPEIVAKVEEVYAVLQAAGIEVLYDDRDERAGVKFNDADLLGLPLRLTMGKRGVENGIVELKKRRTGEGSELALDGVVAGVQAALDAERARIAETLLPEQMG
ncbi:MAG: proline--tRNA ligase [Chloroflexi bacterium]|nr:MAG: proline--tRNA ligase [Chloroflexota bacterium]